MSTTSSPPAAPARRRYLHRLLSRARRPRWRRQALRRRPWVVRPLTPGEQALLSYRLLAQELAGLLAPFRRTRLRGHAELSGLLLDADTRPAVVAQVRALQACLDRVGPEYVRQDNTLTRWRQQWERASAAQQRQLIEVEKAVALNSYHNGLNMLVAEAKADIRMLETLCPAAFVAPAASVPWLDDSSPASPTPYSK